MKKSLDLAAPILTALLLLGFAVLALRGLMDPQGASARFGTTVSDSAGTLFYKVYLSRNLVIVIAAAALLILRMWQALAILISATALLPLFDMAVLSQSGRFRREQVFRFGWRLLFLFRRIGAGSQQERCGGHREKAKGAARNEARILLAKAAHQFFPMNDCDCPWLGPVRHFVRTPTPA